LRPAMSLYGRCAWGVTVGKSREESKRGVHGRVGGWCERACAGKQCDSCAAGHAASPCPATQLLSTYQPMQCALFSLLAPAIVTIPPGPIAVAIVSPHHDGRRTIHHWRWGYHHGRRVCHDHGCRVDDSWWWESDYDGRRCDGHRQPDTNGYLRPCMGRERQGNSGKADNSDQDNDSCKRCDALHGVCPLRVAERRRPFLYFIVPLPVVRIGVRTLIPLMCAWVQRHLLYIEIEP